MTFPPLRSTVFPAHSTLSDIAIASVFLLATAASLVSAKTMAFSGAIFITLLLINRATRGKSSFTAIDPVPSARPLLGLVSLAAASLIWAPDPSSAVYSLTVISLIGVGVILAVRAILADTPSASARFAESLWIGLLIGMLYLIARTVAQTHTDMALLPAAAHKFVTFSPGEITRAVAPVTLLFGPALLALSAGINKPWNTGLSVLLITLAVAAVALSLHETSKLALIIWALIFLLTKFQERFSYRMLQVAWVAACLLIVPAALAAKSKLELHNAPWLQLTAQQRILIWNEYSERILERPVFGHGFDMAAVVKPEIKGLSELYYERAGVPLPENLAPFRAVHPHNGYLQIWFELGAAGALLLLATGLAVLSNLAQHQTQQKPYLYATAAAAATMMFSSYGLWQIWFSGLLGFAAIACAVAIRVSTREA